ncbi:MAG TPA: hypothetical protein VFC46_09730 [Humisphaera sp.]|nr:hypothetical protein [Humisphaera sp.]
MLALLVGWACYAVSGVSLGLFFGPILLVTFLAPGLAMAEDATIPRLIACAGLTLGIALIWLISGNLSAFDAVRCIGVLAAYIFALAGLAAFLSRLGMGPTYPAAIAVVIGFAWLTWPVWLCPWLDGRRAESIAHVLAVAHPLMAINGVLFDRFNIWDRYMMSYQQLTTLNQDVFYTLPKTIFWMVAVHGVVGAIGFLRVSKPGLPSSAIK